MLLKGSHRCRPVSLGRFKTRDFAPRGGTHTEVIDPS